MVKARHWLRARTTSSGGYPAIKARLAMAWILGSEVRGLGWTRSQKYWIGNAYMPHLVWGGYTGYAREQVMKESRYNVTEAVNLLEGK